MGPSVAWFYEGQLRSTETKRKISFSHTPRLPSNPDNNNYYYYYYYYYHYYCYVVLG